MSKNTKLFLILLIAFSAACVALSVAQTVHGEQKKISHRQQIWLYALEWCESHGKETAINPKDSDGTASYGPLQFKPATIQNYMRKYPETATGTVFALMSYETQEAIVSNMILDPSITPRMWRHQLFPGCVKKLGQPPQE